MDLERAFEQLELAIPFEGEFQFGEIEVFRVAQFAQQRLIHDLGESLIANPDTTVHGDVEDDGLKRDAGIDGIEESGNLLVTGIPS